MSRQKRPSNRRRHHKIYSPERVPTAADRPAVSRSDGLCPLCPPTPVKNGPWPPEAGNKRARGRPNSALPPQPPKKPRLDDWVTPRLQQLCADPTLPTGPNAIPGTLSRRIRPFSHDGGQIALSLPRGAHLALASRPNAHWKLMTLDRVRLRRETDFESPSPPGFRVTENRRPRSASPVSRLLSKFGYRP